MTWTPELTERCKSLWGKMSSRRIADILTEETGRPVTFNAVICKMNRAGLSFRGVTPLKSRKRRPLRSEMSAAELEAVRAVERDYSRRKRARARGLPLPPLPSVEALAGLPRSTAKPKPKPAISPAPAALALAPPRPVPAPPQDPSIRPSKEIPLTEVREGQCRYIAGDPLESVPATCCGHPTLPGSSWCLGHHRICTVPSRYSLKRAA